jgi:hypothetical protein
MGGNTGNAQGVGHAAHAHLSCGTVNATLAGTESAGCHGIIKRMVHGMLLSVVLPPLYYQSQIFSRFFLIFPLQIHIFVV